MHFFFFFYSTTFFLRIASKFLFLYLFEHGQERQVGGSSCEARLENGCQIKEVRDEAQKGH